MKDIEKSIIAAKKIVFDDKCFDPKYSKVWYGTTENIKEYFELIEWEQVKKVLTVCSSGDHILNLVNKGVKELGLNAERLDFTKNFDLSHVDASNLEEVSRAMREAREEGERLSLTSKVVDENIEQINNTCNCYLYILRCV